MNNYCVISELGSARRENGIGTIELSNRYGINISDDGLTKVYEVYMTEILKDKAESQLNSK